MIEAYLKKYVRLLSYILDFLSRYILDFFPYLWTYNFNFYLIINIYNLTIMDINMGVKEEI